MKTTMLHVENLTIIIDKFRRGKYRLIGTLKAKVSCTFWRIDDLKILENGFNKIQKNKEELLKLLNELKSGPDWNDVSIDRDNNNFRFIGCFDDDTGIDSFINRFLEIFKS